MKATVKMHVRLKTNPEGGYTNLIIDAECNGKKYHSVISFNSKCTYTDDLAIAVINRMHMIADDIIESSRR